MQADPKERSSERGRRARTRIVEAAIARFAAEGVAATSLKAIAADAGVSPPLVIHHFGSKEGLLAACDALVVATLPVHRLAVMAAGSGLDPLQVQRDRVDEVPLLRYLADRLTSTSAEVAQLVDEAVEDAVTYLEAGVRSGLLEPTACSRERAVVLMLWNLGALAMHRHAQRLLGVDLTDDTPDLLAWIRPATELLAEGIFTDEAIENVLPRLHEGGASRPPARTGP